MHNQVAQGFRNAINCTRLHVSHDCKTYEALQPALTIDPERAGTVVAGIYSDEKLVKSRQIQLLRACFE